MWPKAAGLAWEVCDGVSCISKRMWILLLCTVHTCADDTGSPPTPTDTRCTGLSEYFSCVWVCMLQYKSQSLETWLWDPNILLAQVLPSVSLRCSQMPNRSVSTPTDHRVLFFKAHDNYKFLLPCYLVSSKQNQKLLIEFLFIYFLLSPPRYHNLKAALHFEVGR